MTAHATLLKFNHTQNLVHALDHWVVLLRPAQVTLGALVLVSIHDDTSLGALPVAAFAELKQATGLIESGLKRFQPYDKINYLALMMVDPQVHFHVIPRYATAPEFMGTPCPDSGWPGVPDLTKAIPFTDEQRKQLLKNMIDAFAC